MARYRVIVRTTSTDVVDAENEYMAAVLVAERYGNGVEIAEVRPAVGRVAANGKTNGAHNGAATAKKKRRSLSPEAKARLAQNLVKARAARAAKARARKKAVKKKTAKRSAKRR
jgi:hypothetical protein